MKKRILSVFIVCILCIVSIIGCKKSESTSTDIAVEDGTEEGTVYTFGFTCLSMQNPYFITLEQALRTEIESKGHVLITKDPATDSDKQIQQIKEFIEEGVDAIFLHPVDWIAITPALELLQEANIKIINIDCEVKAFSYVDAYIGSNNVNAGILCGLDMVEQLPEGGKIAIMESKTQNSVNDRIRGFEQVIANKGFEVVGRSETMGELNTAREEAYKIFQEHPDVVAVMCGNDQTALGALVAANMAGLKHIKIYGVDGSPDLKKELMKSDTLIRGTSAQSPINMGTHAGQIGVALLNGEVVEKTTYEEVFFIHSDNVDLYGSDGWQ